MTTLLFFDAARCRPPKTQAPPDNPAASSAKVLMFTGIRRERLDAGSVDRASQPYEPMFDDPLPAKPVRKKRLPQKNS